MSKTPGVLKAVKGVVFSQRPGGKLSVDQIVAGFPDSVKRASRSGVSNAICKMVNDGYLLRNGGKGHYIVAGNREDTIVANLMKTNGHAKPVSDDPETVVIDELLNAMAKAEPILKKWKRIQEVLREIS